MYTALSVAMCAAATLLAVAMIIAATESYNTRRDRRALALIEWAARRVDLTYLKAMRQASAGGLTEKDLQKSHQWIIDRAVKMAEFEGIDIRRICGGDASLQAYAWCALSKRL